MTPSPSPLDSLPERGKQMVEHRFTWQDEEMNNELVVEEIPGGACRLALIYEERDSEAGAMTSLDLPREATEWLWRVLGGDAPVISVGSFCSVDAHEWVDLEPPHEGAYCAKCGLLGGSDVDTIQREEAGAP